MMMSGKDLNLEKPRFELTAKGARIQTGKIMLGLHRLAGRSRSSGQQLEKHGYRRLIAANCGVDQINYEVDDDRR